MNDDISQFYALPTPEDDKWEKRLLRLLMSPRPRRDLERRLRQSGCPDETAAELLDRFEEAGLIDDKLYALLYIDSKRDFGALRLRDELRARGVSSADIEDALDECDIDEVERAGRLLAGWARLPGATAEKLASRLRRRGFSGSTVREALAAIDDSLLAPSRSSDEDEE